MANDTSDTTGEEYYSGSWKDVKNVLSVLDIGAGKLAKVNMELVNFYQEMVDRQIDDTLGELYHVPLRSMNQCQPDGITKRVFPGSIRRLARYWTAGLLLLNEFQQLSQNITDQGTAYIDVSRRELYSAMRMNHRLWGQEWKSNISRTMPPTMQPPDLPEASF
jgi:hypothetical protein